MVHAAVASDLDWLGLYEPSDTPIAVPWVIACAISSPSLGNQAVSSGHPYSFSDRILSPIVGGGATGGVEVDVPVCLRLLRRPVECVVVGSSSSSGGWVWVAWWA